MRIGEFLQKYIDKSGISQAELARKSGVPASTISSIINRNNDRVAIEMMLKLCEVLNCDLEEYIDSLKLPEQRSSHSDTNLTHRQIHIVELFSQLTEAQQDNIIGRAELLVEQNEEANNTENVS